jgi:hypothetical protein
LPQVVWRSNLNDSSSADNRYAIGDPERGGAVGYDNHSK